jgi:rubredoxin
VELRVSELTRTYVCPACGYDGFKAGTPHGTIDFNVQWGCPMCQTMRGLTVWLVETSDPRDEGMA